jgi:DNA-binding FadR family transcriptional regulator
MEKRESLSNRVIKLIKNDIAQGKFKLNEKIPAEPELMQLYSVGRSTIREAIKTLAISGILKVQQGSGTFVNSFVNAETIEQRLKRADFDQINSVRKLLEGEIVKLAAQNNSAAHIAQIEQSLENRKLAIQSENRQACVDADIAFHMAIAQASLNNVLADLYESFTLLIRDFFSKREAQGISHFAMSHHLHEQLFKAIKAQKVKHAGQLIQQILDNNY